MIPSDLIEKTRLYVYELFEKDSSGHDYYHIERVVVNALKIINKEQLTEEQANRIILSAWLHDLGDYKLNDGVDRSEELISQFLVDEGLSVDEIQKIVQIVSEVSFSKGKKVTSIEAAIVQDADRLDAIGAIGVARCFAYGGSRNRPIFIPDNKEENQLSSIQHFYDKLLHLKKMINTSTAKSIAEERHQFMENFLNEFFKEIRK